MNSLIKKLTSIALVSGFSLALIASALVFVPTPAFADPNAIVDTVTFTSSSATITGKVSGVNDTTGIVLKYSLAGAPQWTDTASITWNALAFTAVLSKLTPGASYDYGMRQGDDKTGTILIGKQTFAFTGAPTGSTTGSGTAGDITIHIPLDNPLTGDPSIPAFVATALNTVVLLLTPVVVIMLLYAGFLFVSAMGNPEKISSAKKVLLYTLIGAAIVLGAKGLAVFIQSTITCLAGGSGC